METAFPYPECMNCNYRAVQESMETYGPRSGGINISDDVKACRQKVCSLELNLGSEGFSSLSSK